jgi:hypothetical protein
MKRRHLIYRTVATSVSAAIFTATGWLMGTRTLTMSSEPLPPCNGNGCSGLSCGEACYTYPTPSCVEVGCSGACRRAWTVEWGCNGWGCPCRCKTTLQMDQCGTCSYPCLN